MMTNLQKRLFGRNFILYGELKTDDLASALRALRSIKNVLDGMDNWESADVRANASCAYSIAEDALAADEQGESL
jgi:hypothetical protein